MTESEMSETAQTATGAKVLVVEDQPLLALELCMVLEDAGFEVVGTAHDRDEALQLIETCDPALALIDVNLRDGMTGPGIADTFCGRPGRAAIFLTANPEQVPPGFAGALGMLTKPVDPASVRAAVIYALDNLSGLGSAVIPSRLRLAPGFRAAQGRS